MCAYCYFLGITSTVPTCLHTHSSSPCRRRGQKMAIDRLKKALSEHPHALSLQTALKAAVEEVTVSSYAYHMHCM